MAVTWSVGALAWRFACVSFSGSPFCVPSYIHTFLRSRRQARIPAPLQYLALFALACVGIPLALVVPLGLCCVRFVAVVRTRVRSPVPSSRYVPRCVVWRRARWCVVVRLWLASVAIPCRACGGSLSMRARAHLLAAGRPRAPLRVFCAVVFLLCFSMWRLVFGGPYPSVAFTHLACLMASPSYVCGG